jgi:hypothetical protein
MYLHRGRIQRQRFDLEAHDLFPLQLLKHSIQHTVLSPPVHAHVNGVPVAELLRKTAPFTALLSHIQKCIEHLQVRQPHISALYGQTVLDEFILLLGDFHLPSTILSSFSLV